jgi:hypothetical protein
MQISNIIDDLLPHMLTQKNIVSYSNLLTRDRKQDSGKKNPSKNIIKTTDNIFFPKQKDSLFWCFFIAFHGLHEYEIIHNFFTKEKEIKYKWIEELRNKKEIFKPIKISKTTVEDELANCPKISMNTVKALCYLFDINIFYIDNKKFYEIITDENKPIFAIEKKENIYGLKKNLSTEQLEYYRNHFWKLENLDKPLKAISSYKINDLRNICSKLHIDFTNMTRPQIYQAILSYL